MYPNWKLAEDAHQPSDNRFSRFGLFKKCFSRNRFRPTMEVQNQLGSLAGGRGGAGSGGDLVFHIKKTLNSSRRKTSAQHSKHDASVASPTPSPKKRAASGSGTASAPTAAKTTPSPTPSPKKRAASGSGTASAPIAAKAAPSTKKWARRLNRSA